jgi:iron(III) transport system substrate-binding protein
LQSGLLRSGGFSLCETFRIRTRRLRAQLSVYLAAIGFACFPDALAVEKVVVYSSVKNVLARAVAEHFEKETGTEVRLVPNNHQATSKELLDRLIAEKKRAQADVFWSCDPVGAIILKSEGLSAPYESPNAKTLPGLYRDPERHWTGFPARARVIIYNKNLLTDPEKVPTSVLDMMNPRFSEKACIANPLLGTTLLHATALFQVLGQDFAEAFFNSLNSNGAKMVSTNSEVRRRVAAGDFAFGIADTEDFRVASKQGEPVGVVFPDQQAFGTLVIPAALVLIQHGPDPEQGKRFIDFLLLPEIQKLLVASEPAPLSAAMPALDKIKPMEVDFSKLVSESKELSSGFLSQWVRRQK